MQPAENPYLSVIIPCYNEASRLPTTLVDIDRYLSRVAFTYEIIVVDDGSTDATADIAERMSKAIPHMRVVSVGSNKGKGTGVKQGMLEARGSIRVFTDADNATTMDEFAKFQPFFAEAYQVVFASRAMPDSVLSPAQPWYRQVFGRGGNLFIRLINLPGVRDSQCGFKAFTAEAAQEIFSRAKMTGFGFDIEALALARALGYKTKEVGVNWTDKAGSRFFSLSGYLQIFTENLRIRMYLLKGSYALPSKEKGL